MRKDDVSNRISELQLNKSISVEWDLRVIDTVHMNSVYGLLDLVRGGPCHTDADTTMTRPTRGRHVGACADVVADMDYHVCSSALDPMATSNGGVSPAGSGTKR